MFVCVDVQAHAYLETHQEEKLPDWKAHNMPAHADAEGAKNDSVYCATKMKGLKGPYSSKAHAKFMEILEAKFDEFIADRTAWTPGKLPSSILYAIHVACRLVSSLALSSHSPCASTSKRRLNLRRLVAVRAGGWMGGRGFLLLDFTDRPSSQA